MILSKVTEKTAPKPAESFKGYKLSSLPKYLSFRAAISHNERVLKNTLVSILILWGIQFSLDSYHDLEMARNYRKKEFLLAPSEITGITPVKPKTVPNSYVDDISSIYLSLLGNVNALNIGENYAQLQKHMSDQLRIKFGAEVASWVETVKEENISEVLKIRSKKISTSSNGLFKVTAFTVRERYTGHNYVGQVREKIEMVLKLMAPTSSRKWFLQVEKLSRGKNSD